MEKTELEGYVNQGLTHRAIAVIVGKSPNYVMTYLIKYELKTDRTKAGFCCTTCGETRPEKFSDKKYLNPTQRVRCVKCLHKPWRNISKIQKQKAVDYKGGSCKNCGYRNCLAALHFHHRNPDEKDPKWANITKLKFESQKRELDKCDLLCANCHAEEHHILNLAIISEDLEYHI